MFDFDIVQSGLVILVLMAVGEVLSKKMKAILPAILVSGVIYLALIWAGILPADIVSTSGFTGLITIAMSMIIIGMGASTNFAELKANIRVVAISAIVFIIQTVVILVVITLVYDKNMALGSLPGGSNVALIIQARARELGYENIVVLSVLMISFKGLVSSPIVSIMISREVTNLLKEPELLRADAPAADNIIPESSPARSGFLGRLFCKGPCPKDESFYVTLIRIYIVAWIAGALEKVTGLSRFVYCLLLGVVFVELGFLHKDDLERTGINKFLTLLLMSTVMSGFSNATPQMIAELAGPLVIVMASNVVSITLSSALLSRAFGFSKEMAIAFGFQGMMGFPLNLVISQDVIASLTDDKELADALNSRISTKVILAGFTSTTVLSVIIAGILIGFMT